MCKAAEIDFARFRLSQFLFVKTPAIFAVKYLHLQKNISYGFK
jgi:hypothetical protein